MCGLQNAVAERNQSQTLAPLQGFAMLGLIGANLRAQKRQGTAKGYWLCLSLAVLYEKPPAHSDARRRL